MRLFGPFQLPSRLVAIGTSHCRLFNGKSCHLSVNLEHKPLWAMKLLNIDASVTALERKYQILELEVTGSMHSKAHYYIKRKVMMLRCW